MKGEIKKKIRDLLITANRLDNAASISDDVSEATWLAAMTELTIKAQGELLEIGADLNDAEAARLERELIGIQEMAAGENYSERVA